MALLQSIRNKAGIFVIIFVGVALFLFIIDPQTFQQLFHKSDRDIAKINGENVEYTEWSGFYDVHRQFREVAQQGKNLTAEDEKSIKEQAWQDLLKKYIWNPYYEEVGIGVSEEEMEDLLYGPKHVHSIVVQNFNLQQDPQSGEYDTKEPKNFFENVYTEENVAPQYVVIADYWKKVIGEDRISTKYSNMLTQGFYTPSVLAKMYYEEQNASFDLEYVMRNYNTIADEDIQVTDAEIEKYYNEHKNMFVEDNATRDIEYVVYDVVPSHNDSVAIYEEINGRLEEFKALEENENIYADNYSDNRFRNDMFLTKEVVESLGFNEEFFNSEVGTVSDITISENAYIFGKIMDVANRPDSVNASHILLIPSDSVSIESCETTADSLKAVLAKASKDTALFAQLAQEYSQDPGSKDNGGNLGDFTEGAMIDEFNEACFSHKTGDLVVVKTQYGVHLIKINSQTAPVRKIKLVAMDKEIRFSDNTYDYMFQKASTFSANNTTAEAFDNAVTEEGLVKKVSNRLRELGDALPGVDNAREIVRWAFNDDTKVGDVSNVFVFADKYIVAKLVAAREKGVSPLEDVRAQIEPTVLKKMKAAKLLEEMKGCENMSMDEIATKFNSNKEMLMDIKFGSYSLPGIGIEPKVNATVCNIDLNKVSAPIEGNNGIFVVKVTKATPAAEQENYDDMKLAKMREYSNQKYRMDGAVRKMVEIKDKRAKFF